MPDQNYLTPLALSDALHDATKEFEDIRLRSFLFLSLVRVAKKLSATSERTLISIEDLRHIVDWLKAALINDAAWIRNVDDKGRPKKLMKFSTVDQIVREADKAMVKASQTSGKIALAKGDEELVQVLEGGYYVVKLLTPAALDRESAEMQHCIGNGAYDAALEDDESSFFSLRDPNGRAHVTLEMSRCDVVQIQGKQNKRPIKKYVDILIPFLKERVNSLASGGLSRYFVTDTNGNWYPFDSIPSGITVNHDVVVDADGELELPDDLTIRGDLTVHEGISRLPKGLVVHGRFRLFGRTVDRIPGSMIVHGDLEIDASNVVSVENGFTVKGRTELNGKHDIVLSDGVSFGGDVILRNKVMSRIPNDFHVGGDLSIFTFDTSFSSLPNGLVVGGSLRLWSESITELPADIKVGNTIDLRNTNVKRLPDDLTVGGSLLLSSSAIWTLPKRLHVKHDLTLNGTAVSKVPSCLRVGGNLDLMRTKIQSLPDNFSVGGNLNLRGLHIRSLPAGLRVGNTLALTHVPLSALPVDLVVGCDLILLHSPVSEIPDTVEVGGAILTDGSDVAYLPDKFRKPEENVSLTRGYWKSGSF